MAQHRTTAPAPPDASTTTPPATATGAGTSEGPVTEPQAAPEAAAATSEPASEIASDTEGVKFPIPGSADFDAESPYASATVIEEHIRILEARKKLKALTDPEAPAETAPVPVTIVEAAASPTTPAQPDGITKIDRRNGNPQTLPAKAWALLSEEDAAYFEEPVAQPAKPDDLK